MIKKELFGKLEDGTSVNKYILTDGERELTVLDFGGTVQSLKIPDKNGKLTDVVLGYNTLQEYQKNAGYLGAAVGRYANRIENGLLTIDNITYKLYNNNGKHHLHGGKIGFSYKMFNAEIKNEVLSLTYLSKDSEENYPGNLNITINYSLIDGEFKIEYFAKSDKKTAVNLTNHSYFNLNGAGSGNILKHILMLDADYVTPTDNELIPHGEYLAVKNTALDFTSPKEIGLNINSEDEQLKNGNGYDINYVLNKKSGFSLGGYALGDKSGIKMEFYTDKPAVQLYTGNYLNSSGKGFKYNKNDAFCLETQFIPNGVLFRRI